MAELDADVLAAESCSGCIGVLLLVAVEARCWVRVEETGRPEMCQQPARTRRINKAFSCRWLLLANFMAEPRGDAAILLQVWSLIYSGSQEENILREGRTGVQGFYQERSS